MTEECARQCADRILSTIPMMMRAIGQEIHEHDACEITIPQFRALMTLQNHAGATVSLMAEHLGVSLPAVSRLIDGLVERGFITRATPAHDRRRVQLSLTEDGRAMLGRVHQQAIGFLAGHLTAFLDDDLERISQSMVLLQSVFGRFNPLDEMKVR